MHTHTFDETHVSWHQLDGIENAWYRICDVDVDAKIVDVLFKFDAHKKVILHKHHADYRTLVIQGELRIYHRDGSLKETRPTGSYVVTAGGGEPHTEGGGEVDAIVFFSYHGTDGMIYEVLDDDLYTLATQGLHDFKGLLEAQAVVKT